MNEASLPSSQSVLAHVICHLSAQRDDVRTLRIEADWALLKLGKKTTLALFCWDEAGADELAKRLEAMTKLRVRGRLVVGLLGGRAAAHRVLVSAGRWTWRSRFALGLLHIDDTGRPWTRNAKVVSAALSGFETTLPPSQETWHRVLETSTATRTELAQEQHEHRQFQVAIRARTPIVTYSLAAIILLVFGLEHLAGGSQSAAVLLRMGALSPQRVWQGELWRLLSCTFLHAGLMHVGFNTYVLWVLGTFLERILGSWRFLLLYGLSCLGASLVSLFFLQGFSVGASGGLWGILAAQAVLAWRAQGLLPRALIGPARRAATINLGINLLNSFRPHVDMWAHFGGGAVGGFLLLSTVLTRGLPRLGKLEAQPGAGASGEGDIPSSSLLKASSLAIAALLLASLGLAQLEGRPWALRQPIERVRTELPSLGMALSLPAGLARTTSGPGEAPSVRVGELISEPGALVMSRFSSDLRDPGVLTRERASLVEKLRAPPSGAVVGTAPEALSIAGRPGITVRYDYANGLEEELSFVFLEDALIKVDTVRAPAFGDAVPRGYARSVLESLERLEPPAVADPTARESAPGSSP